MLKKITSKVLALKTKIRALETRLIIESLMLRDKKGFYHLFRQARERFLVMDKDGEDDYQSDYISTLIHNPAAATSIMLEENILDEETGMAIEEEEYQMEEAWSMSAIEMAKNANEGQGKEFQLEDDIDLVADLFIQRFHEQIRMQKLQPDSPLSYFSV